MSLLLKIITADEVSIRNRSLDAVCQSLSAKDLLEECEMLDAFRRESTNLYERVRALLFLYAIHRYHLPRRSEIARGGLIPFEGYSNLLNRRYQEAIETFLAVQGADGPNKSISSALGTAYRGLGFQTLADQVRRSVRSVSGNQWMFRAGHPDDHPLRVRPELKRRQEKLFPVLREATPVRMDLTHSGWSDIFFLGMDFPEGARVINTSIDLVVRHQDQARGPTPPVEAYFRIIDEPLLRLTSVDLKTTAEITSLAGVFDFARDYLGLLKAAVIASGIVPPGMEGADQPLSDLLAQIAGPGNGIEIVSRVNDIPKGSRLAVSTSLLACLIAVCMRATGQARTLTGRLSEDERRLVAARAILGEWLAGSGGGWQDSGGVWPSMKLIKGELASQGDPEYGISRGRLLPSHRIFTTDEVSHTTRQKLQDSLVLVHGGMAQDVGPILELVTEKYLLRSEKEWAGRQEAIQILDQVIELLKQGDVHEIGKATDRNFHGPIQAIIPWAGNYYTDLLNKEVKKAYSEDYWGFWMLGGMAGGGMGFIFDPKRKIEAQDRMQEIMTKAKRQLERAVPFAMDPVVYDFAINEDGTTADLSLGNRALMPAGYYALIVPSLLRRESGQLSAFRRAELDRFGQACRDDPGLAGMVQTLFDRLLPRSLDEEGSENDLNTLLSQYGFDRRQHEQIRTDLQAGRIGLAKNRLPVNSQIEDVLPADIYDSSDGAPKSWSRTGMDALAAGEAAVVSLAGGTGSRWTKGAGVVKALNPFAKINGRHRSFIEVHLAKSRRMSRLINNSIPHIITTSYLTHKPIAEFLEREDNYGYEGPLMLSPGRVVGLRMIPMVRDLRFAWEETAQQLLDEQAQKVVDSLHNALIEWANIHGEGNDYTDNLPVQCLHPMGHWYEIPNLLRNGVLARLLDEQPNLKYLMVHNIDTLGTDLDPSILGCHIESNAPWTSEVIFRQIEDRGGGLARINGQLRLIEGLSLPREEIEFNLSYYNTNTYWLTIDPLLQIFGLTRTDLGNEKLVSTAVRKVASRMPTYVTIKDVKKRWGHGHEDVYPVAQFEKLWGDMTALSELDCSYISVHRFRGQQLKEIAHLDGWLRDGSAEYLNSICDWD